MNLAHSIKKILPSRVLGMSRAMRSTLYSITNAFNPYFTSRKYLGYKLYYIKGTGIVDRLRFGSPEKVYEKELCELLAKELSSVNDSTLPVFFDIGANIGLISLYVAKHTKSLIFSFEPGSSQLSTLHTNIVANNLSYRWQAVGKALSSKNGAIEFFSSVDVRHSGSDGLVNTERSLSEVYSYIVETTTLDTWCSQFKTYPSVLKIDVEGAEKYVLEGGKEIIQKYKPIIFLEISPANLKSYPYKARDVVEYIQSIGYQVYHISGEICTTENVEILAMRDDVFIARHNVV